MTERINKKALGPWTGVEKRFTIQIFRSVIDNDTQNTIDFYKVDAILKEEEYDHIMDFLKKRGVI